MLNSFSHRYLVLGCCTLLVFVLVLDHQYMQMFRDFPKQRVDTSFVKVNRNLPVVPSMDKTTISTESRSIITSEPSTSRPLQFDDPSEIHIVFSTGCSQGRRRILSATLQYTAARVGQRGPITQIFSGCSQKQIEEIRKEPTFYHDFRLHFSPSYSPHPKPEINDNYGPYNKPFGLRHWLHHTKSSIKQSIIALVDADFLFIQKLTVNNAKNTNLKYVGARNRSDISDHVFEGSALAQDWSVYMGAGYWSGNGKKAKFLCKDEPCSKITSSQGREFYASTGPPYIMHIKDALKFIDDYCRFTIEGRKMEHSWMVEMYAYALAAANHGIKHTILTNLGVTHPKMGKNHGEYWPILNSATPNPCTDIFTPVFPKDPPIGIHYCQKYGNITVENESTMFYKYHLPEDLLECDSKILAPQPPQVWDSIKELKLSTTEKLIKRQEVWMQCTITKVLNQVLMEYKKKTCPLGYNSHRGVKLIGKKVDTAMPK